VDVADYGISGVHLAYELLDGRYDTLILIDAVPAGEPPGTVSVLEARPDAGRPQPEAAVDAHAMHPEAVLGLLRNLGGGVDRVLVVGCQPGAVEERMGLSEPVRAAVAAAVGVVAELAHQEATRNEGAGDGRR
jgi:hydrogenase maturation protease